jgi:hypothetical protein
MDADFGNLGVLVSHRKLVSIMTEFSSFWNTYIIEKLNMLYNSTMFTS